MTSDFDGDAWICSWLIDRRIPFRRFDHPAVFTCEEADRHVPAEAVGVQTKNLFLRDKKGVRHWLAITSCDKAVDIRALGETLAAGRLSFASAERLQRFLGVTPGAVTALALAYEGAAEVSLVIDSEIWGDRAWRCHPMVNTATLVLDRAAVDEFFRETGHAPQVVAMLALRPGGPTADDAPSA